ncbi:MAG: hypothetical protein ACKVT2_08635 [Saprospiraceae bacterium]
MKNNAKTFLQVLLLTIGYHQIAFSQNDLRAAIILTDAPNPVVLDSSKTMNKTKLPNKSIDELKSTDVIKDEQPLVYRFDDDRIPSGNHKKNILITFFKVGKPPLEIRSILKSVIVSIDGSDPKEFFPSSAEEGNNFYWIPLKSLKGAKSGSLVTVTLKLKDEVILQKGTTYYFNYFEKKSFYGAFNNNLGGVWFPTGMFATNFNNGNNGINFAPMPLGIAWGLKQNFKNSQFYLGYSATANWLIYNDDTDPANKKFSLSAASLGLMIDVGNIGNIGVCYGFDFRKETPNPRWALLVGISPGTLNFLKSSH